MVPSTDLEAAYTSLSQALFNLLIRDDLPRPVGNAIFRFVEDVRGCVHGDQVHKIEACCVQATMDACLTALTKAELMNGHYAQGEKQ